MATLLESAKSNRMGSGESSGTLGARGPSPSAASLEAQDAGCQGSCGHAPVLAATASLRALAGGDRGEERAHLPTRPEPLSERRAGPLSTALGGQAEEVRGVRGYLYGPPRLALPAWSRPGISNLLAQLVWWRSWVPPGWRGPRCARKALGVEEKGGEGEALARGRQSREGRAVRGSWPSWGRPTVRPKDTGTPYSAPPKSMAPAELGKGTGPDSSLWAPSREGARPVASAAPGSGEEVAGTGHFRLWWS